VNAHAETIVRDGLVALMRRERTSWESLGVTVAEFLDACAQNDLTNLIYKRLAAQGWPHDWPQEIRHTLAPIIRRGAAIELARAMEIKSVLARLHREGIEPVLLKGAALAYSIYDDPADRPRDDTDLLIREEDVGKVEEVLCRSGYIRARQCDGTALFCQFALQRTDHLGITHALDFHWKISTQALFANVLTYSELAAQARPIPALGDHARAPAAHHSLLLACIHPAMHHRNVERLLWTYDIHLLLSNMQIDFDLYTPLALERRVAAICRERLLLAQARFVSPLPNRVVADLSVGSEDEPSRAYLRPGRRWHDDLASSLRNMPDWRERGRLVAEVLFPARNYMLDTYGFSRSPQAFAVLPFLYVHRAVRGACNVLRGHK
jgi:Uncharacterised nucleotidyltransferase